MATEKELFYLRVGEADATGYPVDDGFVVNEGSVVRNTITDSLRANIPELRKQLLDEGVITEDGGHFRFTRDYKFRSPSGAGAFVKGSPSNGWHDWKNAEGISLNRVMRVSLDASDTELTESQCSALLGALETCRDEDGMLSPAELQRHYSLFRQRFGPDQLSALDGEELLEFMHDHGRPDSLVYWIEFKTDEEFKTKELGSIAGGSTLKFRVFRRKESGNWQAGPNNLKKRLDAYRRAASAAETSKTNERIGAKLLQVAKSGTSTTVLAYQPSDEDFRIQWLKLDIVDGMEVPLIQAVDQATLWNIHRNS